MLKCRMNSRIGILTFLGIAIVGCNGSESSVSTTAAAPPKKSPGYTRLVNLTNLPAEIYSKQRLISPAIQPNQACELLPIGTGAQTIRVIPGGGKEIQVKLNLASDKGASIILMPDMTTKVIENEERYASTSSNTHIVPVEAGGTMPATFKVEGGETKSYPSKDTMVLLPTSANVVFPDGFSTKLDDRIAFSLFVVAKKDKTYYILGKNASDRKPVSNGQSAS